jgi:hypothetical protein
MIERHENAKYSGPQLQETFAATALLFGLVEICCGVGANVISDFYGYSSLLYLSALFMLVSFKMILDYDLPKNLRSVKIEDPELENPVLNSPNLLIIGLMQAGFEILFTVFVSFWAPALGKAAKGNHVNYGYIFSSLMVSVMIGSRIYSYLSGKLSDYSISSMTFGLTFL